MLDKLRGYESTLGRLVEEEQAVLEQRLEGKIQLVACACLH